MNANSKTSSSVSQKTGKDLITTVYNDLLEAITNGTYASGERLPSENELKDRYGVSRNTVRSAINRLATLGVIETRRGDGSYVRRQGIDTMLRTAMPILALQKYDLLSILKFRKALEVEAVRIAADKAEIQDLVILRRLMRQMRQSEHDMTQFSVYDAAMHKQLARASHNELFISMLDIVQHILTNDMEKLLVEQGTDIDSIFYHERIIECIEIHKPDEAAFFMRQHLNAVISRIEQKS